MVNDPLAPPLDSPDDCREVLRLHRICLGFMHVPKGRAEIVEGALAISVAEALDGTLKAKNPEVEKLDAAVIAHATDHGGTGSTGGYR